MSTATVPATYRARRAAFQRDVDAAARRAVEHAINSAFDAAHAHGMGQALTSTIVQAAERAIEEHLANTHFTRRNAEAA